MCLIYRWLSRNSLGSHILKYHILFLIIILCCLQKNARVRIFLRVFTLFFLRSLFNLETNSHFFFFFFFLCLCAHVSCRVVVSAVRCAACCRRANKLVGTFSLSAPAAPDAAAVGAAASSGGTTASWDEPTRDATRQQPGKHRRRRPPAQHSNCQHHHRGWKQSGVLVPQLPVPISTVSGAGGGL